MASLIQVSRSNGGMPKLAVDGPVMLGLDGVPGDRHRYVDHGGPDKAVLMVSAEFVDGLAERGYPVYPGALGENLTVSGLDPHLWRAGQRYRIADAVIELTTLRQPCGNLNVYGPSIQAELYDARCKAGDFGSPKWAHGGFYARVIRAGIVVSGVSVDKLEL